MLYRIVVGVYGLINIAGGLMAYLMPSVKSIWSLAVGGTCGLLFIWFSFVSKKNPGFAFRASAALCAALMCFWIFRITEVNSQGKSLMMPIMNLVLAFGVLATLGLGHMIAMKKAKTEQH